MKNKIVNKIKSRKGETYIEVLFAVLVITFATLIVAVLYSTAFNLNVSAREKDDAFYTALQQVERLDPDIKVKEETNPGNPGNPDTQVTITGDGGASNTVNVDAYESGGITAYRAQNSTGG